MNNHPHQQTNSEKFVPRLIAWEVTRQCHLKCKHCRGGSLDRLFENEFSTDEIRKVLDNIASFAKPIIILTGGEALVRDDIYDIAEYGNSIGLKMVLATCGMHVTREMIDKMKSVGIQRISLSLDGATAKTHDDFRQLEGSFDGVVETARFAKEAGLEFQINTTVQKYNVDELGQILDLAIELGAASFHPFLLVPTGRAKELVDLEIPPEEYERVLEWTYEKSKQVPITFKPTCAPHYYRIMALKRKEENSAPAASPHGNFMGKGCMGGQSFAFISHVGKLQICGFLDEEAGDLREENYDFKKIWDNSRLFNEIRDIDHYHGKCGYCEFRKVCSGCRARAFAISGDYLDEEPFCIYTPKRKPS